MSNNVINLEERTFDLEIIYKTFNRQIRAYYVLNHERVMVRIPKGYKNPKVTAKAILLSSREGTTSGVKGEPLECVYETIKVKVDIQDER